MLKYSKQHKLTHLTHSQIDVLKVSDVSHAVLLFKAFDFKPPAESQSASICTSGHQTHTLHGFFPRIFLHAYLINSPPWGSCWSPHRASRFSSLVTTAKNFLASIRKCSAYRLGFPLIFEAGVRCFYVSCFSPLWETPDCLVYTLQRMLQSAGRRSLSANIQWWAVGLKNDRSEDPIKCCKAGEFIIEGPRSLYLLFSISTLLFSFLKS